MPSFDVVSQVDFQEIDNAVNQTKKEISTRYDFKGHTAEIELKEKENKIQILTDDDMKLTAIKQILTQKMSKRGISIKSLSFGKSEQAGGDKIRLQAEILNGIPTEKAKKIVKIIKEEKIKKIQAQIQGEQIRITGPKRDHLQDVIELLKVKVEDLDLQYINFRD